MTTPVDVELKPCQCGCGELVPGKWKRGHWARAQKANANLRPLPGPNDVLDDDEDDDELPAELQAEIDQLDWLDSQQPEREPDEPAGDDPPPARVRRPRSVPAPPKRTRVTATVQRDVQAKIRMITMPAARMWEIRDDICGTVAVQQEPEVAAAFAEIVCDSPDLLNWFTGVGGGYMKYFRLFMACWPVLMTVWMHHIAHADQVPGPDPMQPQAPAFAA